jgi:tetratricopeptide (TPR) repeat protein
MRSSRRTDIVIIVIPVVLFFLALGLRLLYLHEMRPLPDFDHPIVDAEYNDRWAVAISQGSSFLEGPYFRAPLYPYFLALVYLLFGHSYLAARLAQFLLGAGSVVLIYLLGRRVFGLAAGTIAGALAALYGTLIYFEGELLIPALFLFLNLLLVLALLTAARCSRPRRWLLGGVLLGLAAIARPNVLVFGAVVFLWMAIVLKRKGSSNREVLISTAAYALGALLVIAPVTVRNAVVGGDFVPIASQGGMNFYIGNHLGSDGVTAVLPDAPDDFWGGYRQARRRAEETAGHALRDSQISNYWFSQGLRFWREHPGQALGLTARKLALFWSGAEIANNKDIYFIGRRAPLLGALIRPGPLYLPFGIVAPLALAGMILAWRRRKDQVADHGRGSPGAGLLAVFVFAYLASIIPFFVTARFRLAVVPFLLPFAAFTLVSIFRGRSAAEKTLTAALILLFGLLINLNLAGYPLPSAALSHVSLGHLYLQQGRFNLAEREFQQALALEAQQDRLTAPRLHALTGLAQVYAQTGRVSRAIDMLEDASSRWSRTAGLPFQLGHLFYLQGRLDRAIDSWQRTVELDSTFQQAYLELGIAYEDEEQFERAVETYQQAIRIDPAYVLARYNLAMLYARLGKLPQAVDQYRAVIEIDPQFADAYAGLAWIFCKEGVRLDEGMELIEQAIAMEPDKSWYRDVQARLYIVRGEPDRAREIFQEMIRREPGNPYWRRSLEDIGKSR